MSSAIENELPLLPRIVETFDSSRSSESSPNASSSRASDPGKTQKDQEASLEESELKTLLELPLPPLPPADDAAAGAADAAALGAALSSVLRVGAARSKGSLSRPSSFALLPTPPDLPAFPEDTRNLFVRIRASAADGEGQIFNVQCHNVHLLAKLAKLAKLSVQVAPDKWTPARGAGRDQLILPDVDLVDAKSKEQLLFTKRAQYADGTLLARQTYYLAAVLKNEVTGKAQYRVLAPPSDDAFRKEFDGVRFKKTLEPMLVRKLSRRKKSRLGRSPNRSRATSRSSSSSSNMGDRPKSNTTSPSASARSKQSKGAAFFANGQKHKHKQKHKQSVAERKGGAATNAKPSNAKPNTSSSLIAKKPSALPSLVDTRRNWSEPLLVLPKPVPDKDKGDDERQLSIMSDSGALEDLSSRQIFDFSSMSSSLRSSLDAQPTQTNESNRLLLSPPRFQSQGLGRRVSTPNIGTGVGPETRPEHEKWTGAPNEEGVKRKLLDKRLSLQLPHLRSLAPISPLARESPSHFSSYVGK